MTQSDPTAPPPATATSSAPSLPSPSAEPARTSPATRVGIRYGMSLVAVLLGCYLLIQGVYQQFAVVLMSRGQIDQGIVQFAGFLFAVVVVLFGLLVAPASLARRAIAAVVFLVITIVYAVVTPLYYLGVIRVGMPGAVFVQALTLGAFMFTLAGAAAWLIVRARPGLSLLFLIATLLIPIVSQSLARVGQSSSVTQTVVNVLVTVLGVGIAWAGRAVAGSRAQPIG